MIRLNEKEDGKDLLINPKFIRLIENNDDDGSIIYSENYAATKVMQSLDEIEDMVLRDQFAMSAMNGVMLMSGLEAYVDCVKDAYFIADEMLKQRKEK